ncbi:MAG: MFS transporter [Candidimonas sp.]|nr:MAG: MFS transporter [Candidimonas sp.]
MSDTAFTFKKIAIPAFGPSLLFGIGKGAILPVIALSARDLQASVAVASLIVGLIGIGSLVSNLPAALTIDRYGERLSMVGAAIVSAIGLLLCVLPTSIWLLALGVFLVGMAQSVFYLARQTYLIDLVPIHLRARAMSTLGGTMRIGIFIGPFLGAALMHVMGLPGAYWMAIAAMIGTGLLAASIPDAQTPRRRSTTIDGAGMMSIARSHVKVLATVGFGILLVSGLRASRQIIIPLWADGMGLSPSATSIIYGLVAAIDMLSFYPAGVAMDRRGRRYVAIPSVAIMGASLVLLPATTGVIGFIVVSMAMGLGNGISSGLVTTLGADASPAVGRTQFLGIWRLISDVGASGAPVLLSAVAAAASLAAASIATGLLGFVAAGVFFRWLPHDQSAGAQREPETVHRTSAISPEHDPGDGKRSGGHP